MEVIWSERARTRLRAVYNYHLDVAGLRTAQRIVRKITDDADRLLQHPQLGLVERSVSDMQRSIRSMVTQKHYKLLYRIGEDAIYIVSLFDCRQNPDKILEDISEY